MKLIERVNLCILNALHHHKPVRLFFFEKGGCGQSPLNCHYTVKLVMKMRVFYLNLNDHFI